MVALLEGLQVLNAASNSQTFRLQGAHWTDQAAMPKYAKDIVTAYIKIQKIRVANLC